MKQFNIELKDEIGVLSRISKLIGEVGVNIESISGETHRGGDAIVRVIPDDEDKMRKLLVQNKLDFEEKDVVVVTVENKPGKLGETIGRISDHGISIFSILTVEKSPERTTFALSVDTNAERI
ncbi:ACT domain-containing protein [Candidatus Undinarchaeota archaeon]